MYNLDKLDNKCTKFELHILSCSQPPPMPTPIFIGSLFFSSVTGQAYQLLWGGTQKGGGLNLPVLVQIRIERQLVPLIEENLAKANFTCEVKWSF